MIWAGLSQSFKSHSRFIAPFLLLLIELIIAFVQAPWDLDPHHDGYVYAAAVAASEGRMPNSEYFQQYGPLASTLQGLFLALTSPSLYSLRLFTGLSIALISLVLYFSARKTIGEFGAFFVGLLWSLSSPRMHATLLPWPSFYSTILLLVAVYCLKKLVNRKLFGLDAGYFLAAVFIFLASLCRINVIGRFGTIVLLLFLRRNR